MGLLYLYLYLQISKHVCSQNTSVDLGSLGILRSAGWYFRTDVSGQPIGTIFKVQLPNDATTLRRVEFAKSTHLIYIAAETWSRIEHLLQEQPFHEVLSTDQDMILAKTATDAHAQVFAVNDELLLPILKAFAECTL
jgi:hypothetical protein